MVNTWHCSSLSYFSGKVLSMEPAQQSRLSTNASQGCWEMKYAWSDLSLAVRTGVRVSPGQTVRTILVSMKFVSSCWLRVWHKQFTSHSICFRFCISRDNIPSAKQGFWRLQGQNGNPLSVWEQQRCRCICKINDCILFSGRGRVWKFLQVSFSYSRSSAIPPLCGACFCGMLSNVAYMKSLNKEKIVWTFKFWSTGGLVSASARWLLHRTWRYMFIYCKKLVLRFLWDYAHIDISLCYWGQCIWGRTCRTHSSHQDCSSRDTASWQTLRRYVPVSFPWNFSCCKRQGACVYRF